MPMGTQHKVPSINHITNNSSINFCLSNSYSINQLSEQVTELRKMENTLYREGKLLMSLTQEKLIKFIIIFTI